MDHTPEELEYFSSNQKPEEKQELHERPVKQRLISWVLIILVLFGFIGTCYWLAFYGV